MQLQLETTLLFEYSGESGVRISSIYPKLFAAKTRYILLAPKVIFTKGDAKKESFALF